MSPSFGKIIGSLVLVGVALLLLRLIVALWRSVRRPPISGPAALGKAIGLAAVGGPFIELTVAVFAGVVSDTYESSTVFFVLVVLIALASSYTSGYLAVHTYEDTKFMNAGILLALGGMARLPALLLLAAFRSSSLNWLTFWLFFPSALVGALHRSKLGPNTTPGAANGPAGA